MRHWRLVRQMAKATDTNVVDAFDTGRLSSEAWSQMVQSCRHCQWADGCQDWLSTHDHVHNAPKTCANRALFRRLRVDEAGQD